MYNTDWHTENQSSFTIHTAPQLAGLAVLVNNGIDFQDKTINSGADIDLSAYGENFNDGKG